MEKKVTVKVFFRPAKNKKNTVCKPFDIVGTLLRSGDLKLVVQGMIAEMESDREENNRNMCIAFMVSLIKNGLSKGWTWVKGKSGRTMHNWLECDGYAIDASMIPGMALKGEENSILVMDLEEYRKALGLKVIQRRNDKQIKKWLTKHKPVQKEVIQDLREKRPHPLNIVPQQPSVSPSFTKPAAQKTDACGDKVNACAGCKKACPENETVAPKPVPEKVDEKKAASPQVDDHGEAPEENVVFELSEKDVADKKSYSEKLTAQIVKFKNSGISSTKIATMLLKKGFPTRSGRGSWNPRMVNDVFKSAANG